MFICSNNGSVHRKAPHHGKMYTKLKTPKQIKIYFKMKHHLGNNTDGLLL